MPVVAPRQNATGARMSRPRHAKNDMRTEPSMWLSVSNRMPGDLGDLVCLAVGAT